MTAATVAGLVLAAGAGRRYGGPKALVDLDGELLVERAARTLASAGCAPLVVVLGAAAERVRAAAQLGGAIAVDNPAWETGMGSSLRAGLTALASTGADAAIVQLVDMPGITVAAVRRFVALATEVLTPGPTVETVVRARGLLAMGSYGERRAHPVLLGRDHWAGAAALAEGDVGARPYLRRHQAEIIPIRCDDVADDSDLDR